MVFTDTDSILHALTIDPNDTTGWFALTDALIEEGREQSARLLRMTLNQLDPDSYDPEVEKQIQAMLLEKVPVVMPRIVNSIGMEFKVTPPGINVMGSPDSEPHRHSDEGPQHLVQMEGLYMGTFPVTQREWEKVMSTNPSTSFKHPGHPVENVSWHDAQEYCKKLSELPEEIAKGYYYELPTEYEWEYSCRGGTRSAYTFGSTLTHDMANFDEKINRTTPVGSYPCNAFGLYDMHGNVWEWCACLYDAQRYKKEVEAAEKALRESGESGGSQ